MKKEELKVGLYFYVDDRFVFSGCSLSEAESYGDFLIYSKSHFDVWNSNKLLNMLGKIPYDFYPRGRIVYRKSDDTFIIYYDMCVEKELGEIAKEYEGFNVKFERDEHYKCHTCNRNYVLI